MIRIVIFADVDVLFFSVDNLSLRCSQHNLPKSRCFGMFKISCQHELKHRLKPVFELSNVSKHVNAKGL